MYLWACGELDEGERGEGEDAPSDSRAAVYAAWVVLLVSSVFPVFVVEHSTLMKFSNAKCLNRERDGHQTIH